MKAVLISIQPKWCELIASGKKTVEVRKTKPKIETPFKCYIYCTIDKRLLHKFDKGERVDDEHFFDKHVFVRQNTWIRGHFNPNKKVIGEFVCDEISDYTKAFFDEQEERDTDDIARFIYHSQIKYADLCSYVGLKDFYGWHISDLVIYDKPKELSEFQQCHKCKHNCVRTHQNVELCKYHRLTRPPQSWCYVEELKGE